MTRVEAHLFAGLGDKLCSGGIEAIEDGLDKLPFDAKWWFHWQAKHVAQEIADRSRLVGKPDLVFIAFYSMGAYSVCNDLFPVLQALGIRVNYLASMDPTALAGNMRPMVCPDIVDRYDEFLASSGFPAAALRRDPSGRSGGKLINTFNVPRTEFKKPGGHVALSRRADVRARIVNECRILYNATQDSPSTEDASRGGMDAVANIIPPPQPASPLFYSPPKRNVNEVIIHCSATPEGADFTVEDIRKWHLARGWSDIGYHFVVYRNGTIHRARSLEKIGAHVKGRNTNTIGVCYIGGVGLDGKTAKDTRTQAQRDALRWLVTEIAKDPRIKKISGHNQYAAKACPSFNVRNDELGNIDGFTKGDRQ